MKRILYIEDSFASQLIFQRMFLDEYELLIAATPRLANVLLETNQVDLIVTDYLFPQDDAFNVITPQRQLHSALELPIIAVSGSMDQALKSRMLSAGVNACVGKPLLKSEFRSLVSRMLSNPFVESGSHDIVTAYCFQWVQDGACHEYCPEVGLHLTGSNRVEVSNRMQEQLHERWTQGATLGRITQERTHAYILRQNNITLPHSTAGRKTH